jgi:hypothetical protein
MNHALFKVICEKGHKANALMWNDQSIEEYIKNKKCNSCCTTLHQILN